MVISEEVVHADKLARSCSRSAFPLGAAILWSEDLVQRLHTSRDHLVTRLAALPGVEAHAPDGAMYVFFRLAGATDSLALCKRLVREAHLGLAPGSAKSCNWPP